MATQDCDKDPLTNLDFKVNITDDITENQIIIMITKFFVFKLNYFGLMPVVILTFGPYKFCFKKFKAKNVIFPEFYITNFNCKLFLD